MELPEVERGQRAAPSGPGRLAGAGATAGVKGDVAAVPSAVRPSAGG